MNARVIFGNGKNYKKNTIRKLAKEEITLIHQKGMWKHYYDIEH